MTGPIAVIVRRYGSALRICPVVRAPAAVPFERLPWFHHGSEKPITKAEQLEPTEDLVS